MAYRIPERVRDTSATTGTGNVTVADSPANGFVAFDDAFAAGDTFPGVIVHASANEWERGRYTYNGSHVIARTQVLGGTNGTSAVNFSSGGLTVFVDPAGEDMGPSIFGDGSDGDVEITGSTTLTRDMYYRNLTLSGSAAVSPAAFRIHVSGVLDISAAPAGAVSVAGGAGPAASGTTGGGTSGAGGGGGTAKTIGAGTGGAGSGLNGVTGNGSNGNASAASGNGGRGGNGGDGGAPGSGGNSSGTGGARTAAATFNGLNLTGPLGQYQLNSVTLTVPAAGGGGASAGRAGGDGTNASAGVGASGGGGGCIIIAARIVKRGTNTTAGIFNAKGGNGGNSGTAAGGNSGGSGGPGGGGGGFFALLYGALLGSQIPDAIDVSGGSGGNGGNAAGTGAGGVGGGSGDSGYCYLWQVAAQPVITIPVAGSNGSAASGATGGAGAAANTMLVDL